MTKTREERRLLPLALHTGAAVRELDRIAIEESGIAGITLMRRAAQACADVVQQCWPAADVVRVFCGSGNNAGDGYLLSGLLAQRGLKVEAIVVGDIVKLGADASAAYQFCEQSDATIQPLSEAAFADGASLFVDALLGIGLSGLVRADFAKVITRINEHSATKGLPVLSVDIPSGLSADNGQVLGVAIRATATVTFIGTKRGLLTGDGTDMVGELYFDDLGVPVDVLKRVPATALRLSNESLAGLLPRRLRNSHKNRFGHILVVGGDQGMGGAVVMSAEAALRTGAGLVSVATHPSHAASLLSRIPELMVRGIATEADQVDSASGIEALAVMVEQCSVVVLGPGLGKSEWSREMFNTVMEVTSGNGKAMVIDADGLNLLSAGFEKRGNWVLTPHPGEASKLLAGLEAASDDKETLETLGKIERAATDRFAMCELLQCHLGGAVVLKGAGSLISDGGEMWLCPHGNPGMSTAGMGDVLSGVVGAMLGQGLSVGDAARLAVMMHAVAGDRAVSVTGERGLVATDLMSQLRKLANEYS